VNRILTVILIFLLGAVTALLVLGYFAYVITTGPPEEARLAVLSQPVEIGFTAEGTVTVEASSLQDAMAGLGFAQAASHIWPLIVYRAAATGQLSALVGGSGASVDELTIQLGLASSAEEAYLLLGEEDRRLLDSFAEGINEALTSRSVLRDPSLVLSGHDPAIWLPWHAIAVERMFAWLAASERPPLGDQGLPSAARLRREHDRDIRATIRARAVCPICLGIVGTTCPS
jgi:acyl-homoserine lactone acylase PvdQ